MNAQQTLTAEEQKDTAKTTYVKAAQETKYGTEKFVLLLSKVCGEQELVVVVSAEQEQETCGVKEKIVEESFLTLLVAALNLLVLVR